MAIHSVFRRDAQSGSDDDRRRIEEALRQLPPFEDLNLAELAALAPAVRVKEFHEEEIVCHCPDASHDAFVVLSGIVAATRKKGVFLYVVRLDRTGALFNVEPLVGRGKHFGGAKAVGSVQVLALDNAMVRMAMDSDPILGQRLMRVLCALALEQYEGELDRAYQ